MSRYLGLLISGIILLILAACGTGDESLASADSVLFELTSEQDLSDYVITEEEEDKKDPVPTNKDLNYIDTLELMRVLDGQSVTSEDRNSYDEIPSEWDVVVIDARPTGVYSAGHINGAINIPDSEFDSSIDRLPEKKDSMIVFYCGGLDCPLSASSAQKAMEQGYKNVYVYQEGMPAWKSAGNYVVVDESYVEGKIMEEAVSREDTEPVILFDARTYGGYFEAHIPTAVFVDNTQYGVKYTGFAPEDKGMEIIAYCGGFFCHKSHQLAEELIGDGYTNVKVFAGGMPSWKQAGLPIFGTNSGDSDFDVSAGIVDRSLSAEEFDEMVQSGTQVVDVRGDSEVASGMIDGAFHIPDGDINNNDPSVEEKLPEDKNTTLVIHCASGARAAGVVEKVVDLGYEEVYYLNGPISISSDGSYSLD